MSACLIPETAGRGGIHRPAAGAAGRRLVLRRPRLLLPLRSSIAPGDNSRCRRDRPRAECGRASRAGPAEWRAGGGVRQQASGEGPPEKTATSRPLTASVGPSATEGSSATRSTREHHGGVSPNAVIASPVGCWRGMNAVPPRRTHGVEPAASGSQLPLSAGRAVRWRACVAAASFPAPAPAARCIVDWGWCPAEQQTQRPIVRALRSSRSQGRRMNRAERRPSAGFHHGHHNF
jgi:hypothetical protein